MCLLYINFWFHFFSDVILKVTNLYFTAYIALLHPVVPGPGAVDFLLHGKKVVIEGDGPSHFMRTTAGWRPTGATDLKRRLLEARGWAAPALHH